MLGRLFLFAISAFKLLVKCWVLALPFAAFVECFGGIPHAFQGALFYAAVIVGAKVFLDTVFLGATGVWQAHFKTKLEFGFAAVLVVGGLIAAGLSVALYLRQQPAWYTLFGALGASLVLFWLARPLTRFFAQKDLSRSMSFLAKFTDVNSLPFDLSTFTGLEIVQAVESLKRIAVDASHPDFGVNDSLSRILSSSRLRILKSISTAHDMPEMAVQAMEEFFGAVRSILIVSAGLVDTRSS